MVAACPFPAPRGTPVRIFRMAESLAARGHQVDVVAYHLGDRTQKTPFRVHRIPGVPTYNKLEPGPSYQKLTIVDSLLTSKVLQLAWKMRPDIIHAHHYEGLLTALPARHLLGIPVVFDSHVLLQAELDYYDLPGLGKTKNRIGKFLDCHLTRRADHVVCVTDDIRNRLIGSGVLGGERITVACNGVEMPFFAGTRGAFPTDGVRRIIFTGNLALYQGVNLMVRAFSLLARARADVRLVVVTGSERAEFEKLAAAAGVLDRIDFMESGIERLPSLIASADVALNPRTQCPGIPQKLLNYMAAGAAVVSFAGSAKHLRDGETALIVPDDDIEAFTRAIGRILDDDSLRVRLGAEARLYARENFSWNNCAAVVEDVYDRVLTRQRPVPPDFDSVGLKDEAPAGAS